MFFVLFTLLAVLYAAVLELSKNTLWGWGAAILLFGAFCWLMTGPLAAKGGLVKLGVWLLMLALLAVNLKLTEPPFRRVPAVDARRPEVTGVVSVREGDLTGVKTADGAVEVYAGIPYAAPPVGENRWREPQPAQKWEGVRVCDHFAPMSMQGTSPEIMNSLVNIAVYHYFRVSLRDNYREPVSEDSLYLNVWKPAGEVKGAPVLFFIHGGSLTSGQTSYTEYNGEALARRGIVVVNCAYRLGVFGYLGTEELAAESEHGTTGNYGLLDQIAALSWVRENIAAFGGDPENITIAGESAGASSVNALCVSPLAEGLFRRAIAESSGITPIKPYHTFRPLADALQMGRDIMAEFGAKDMAALRAVPAEKLVRTSYTNSAMTVDGWAITEQPWLTYEKGKNHEEALLHGFNTHEADLFTLFTKADAEDLPGLLKNNFGAHAEKAAALWPAEGVDPAYRYFVDRGGTAKGTYARLMSAAWFSYSHYNWSRLLAAEGRPAYEYWFRQDNRGLGSNHAGELPYAYGNLDYHSWLYEDADFALSETMLTYWENFIRTGDPNGEGLPAWEKTDGADGRVLALGGEGTGMTEDPNLPLYGIIDAWQEEQR